ncbi:MAG: hypothetical protein H0X37_21835 [Herpetosiphonaceae bacterium]|nr:hypothetical protein [Herpetosiphonaceae bacterium]
MPLPLLRHSTGHAVVDTRLQGLVAIFEALFPQRIRAYYVEGSYADQSAVTTSDLDIMLLFREHFVSATEREQAEQLVAACTALSSLELYIAVMDEAATAQGISPTLKHGSVCFYGADTRDQMPLLPIEEWSRQRMHAAFWLINKVFKRPPVVQLPLTYPDPRVHYYGYTERTVRLPEGTTVPSTRDFIRVSGWAATALLAWQVGIYVPYKRECHSLYRRHIGDEWSEFLADVYRYCRTEWHYLLPATPDDQERLRELCTRMLAWENHFVACYKRFVLAQLASGDEQAQFHAIRFLTMLPFDDTEIKAALQACDVQ